MCYLRVAEDVYEESLSYFVFDNQIVFFRMISEETFGCKSNDRMELDKRLLKRWLAKDLKSFENPNPLELVSLHVSKPFSIQIMQILSRFI